jgi:ACS family hexuronate transporter-like MFS transporter
LNQLAKRLKTAFSLDNIHYSQLESVFSLAFAIGAVSIGFAVDRVSFRWVYPLMVLGWSGAGLLTGFANSFAMLLACRFFLGLFEAGNWPCAVRTTRSVLRPSERTLGNSLFQSGTALGAVITPLLVLQLLQQADSQGLPDAWRIPFRWIGSLGLVWIMLWWFAIPRRVWTQPRSPKLEPAVSKVRYLEILLERRFWALAAVVVAINWTWHGYRTWLPLYLQEQRGYSEAAMGEFTTVYYLVADIGSWTTGLVSLVLTRAGVGVHSTRLWAFGACASLTACTGLIPFLPNGWALVTGLLTVAFGALPLFAIYFALSQEVPVQHQGKITGTLGALAHISLALVYPLEGWICDRTASFEWVLGSVGFFPILALGLFLLLWSPRPG